MNWRGSRRPAGSVPRSLNERVTAILSPMSEQPQPEYLQAPAQLRIRAALGPRAVQVEHVGSTSVLGLAAKPVIDIVLTVIDSSDEAGYLPDLEAAGYVLQFREPY